MRRQQPPSPRSSRSAKALSRAPRGGAASSGEEQGLPSAPRHPPAALGPRSGQGGQPGAAQGSGEPGEARGGPSSGSVSSSLRRTSRIWAFFLKKGERASRGAAPGLSPGLPDGTDGVTCGVRALSPHRHPVLIPTAPRWGWERGTRWGHHGRSGRGMQWNLGWGCNGVGDGDAGGKGVWSWGHHRQRSSERGMPRTWRGGHHRRRERDTVGRQAWKGQYHGLRDGDTTDPGRGIEKRTPGARKVGYHRLGDTTGLEKAIA